MSTDKSASTDGIDFETTLSVDETSNMAQRAAAQSIGDVEHGRQRVVADHITDRALEFRITDWAVAYKKLMMFTVSLTLQNGYVFGSTVIDWHLDERAVHHWKRRGSAQPIAIHTYLQFVGHLAEQVRAADSAARITMRGNRSPAGAPIARAVPAANEAPVSIFGAAGHAVLPPPNTPTSVPMSLPLSGATPSPARIPPRRHVTPYNVVQAPPVPGPLSGGFFDARPAATSRPMWPRPDTSTPASELITGIPEPGSSASAPAPVAPPQPVGTSSAASTWSLILPDGRVVAVAAAVALGRAPVSPPQMRDATPIALVDTHRSLSKTHALLTVHGGMLLVTDLHSTNGTVVTERTGQTIVCHAGIPVHVGDRSTVSLGEFTFTVVRTPPG